MGHSPFQVGEFVPWGEFYKLLFKNCVLFYCSETESGCVALPSLTLWHELPSVSRVQEFQVNATTPSLFFFFSFLFSEYWFANSDLSSSAGGGTYRALGAGSQLPRWHWSQVTFLYLLSPPVKNASIKVRISFRELTVLGNLLEVHIILGREERKTWFR